MRASWFGGSWWNGENAGSRYANLGNWPHNSNDNLGARGRCDDQHQVQTRDGSWSSRSSLSRKAWWSARLSCFGENLGPAERGVAVRPTPSRPAAGFLTQGSPRVGKRYRNLIGFITSPANMRRAYRLTARGKRLTDGYLAFKEYALDLEVRR